MAIMESSSKDSSAFSSKVSLQIDTHPPNSPSASSHCVDVVSSSVSTTSTPTTTKPYTALTLWQKRLIIFMVAFGGLWSPLTANIYNPVVPSLAKEMHVSQELINLTITSYMIFQAITPTFIGDFADNVGRRPAYLISFSIYMFANLGLALSNSFPMLLVLRCLQSMGSSGTVSIMLGVVADVADKHERGSYMGFAYCGPMLAPGFGPVLGGALANFLGWRAIFWFLTVGSGCSLVLFALFFPETGRKIVDNGSAPAQSWNRPLLPFLVPAVDDETVAQLKSRVANGEKHKLVFPNPLRSLSLLRRLDVFMILLATGGIYAAFKSILTATSSLLDATYHLNPLQIGLAYLPNGASGFISSMITGKIIDWNYNRLKNKNAATPTSSPESSDSESDVDIEKAPQDDDKANVPFLEHARISIIWYLLPFAVIPCIGFGWSFAASTSLAAPLCLIFLNGFAVTGIISCSSTLLLDLCPDSPSSIGAVLNFARCIVGALGSGLVGRMESSMGVGWCFTLWGLLSLALCPLLAWVEVYGPRRRLERCNKE